jgi:hypothetical protein
VGRRALHERMGLTHSAGLVRSGLVCFETARVRAALPGLLRSVDCLPACADPDFVHGILRFLRRGVHARTRDGPCATCNVQPKYIVQHAPQPPACVLPHTLVTDRTCTRALALWRKVRRCHETVGECSRVSCFSHQCATLVSQAWRRRLILRHSTPSRCCSCRTHTSPTICARCVRQVSLKACGSTVLSAQSLHSEVKHAHA